MNGFQNGRFSDFIIADQDIQSLREFKSMFSLKSFEIFYNNRVNKHAFYPANFL